MTNLLLVSTTRTSSGWPSTALFPGVAGDVSVPTSYVGKGFSARSRSNGIKQCAILSRVKKAETANHTTYETWMEIDLT